MRLDVTMREIVIVGAGPAGLAAALGLAEAGAVVQLFDMRVESPVPGSDWPEAQRKSFTDRIERAGAAILFRQASAFHAEPGGLWIHAGERAERVAWDVLILATGSVPALAPRGATGTWAEVGRLPENRLAAALGCRHAFDPGLGWLMPIRDGRFETSVPGAYLVGAVAGARTLQEAVAEGEGAAAAILGRDDSPARPALESGLSWFWPEQTALPDDAIICRCNAVSAGSVRAAIAAGARTLHHLGQYGGAGAGHCRGRECQLALAHLVTEGTGLPFADVLTTPAEFPAVSLPLTVFADITPERPLASAPDLDKGSLA